ncbi:hypothetical protein Pelo_19043 [Pelomyxa schiedti]|nr:hypothetical protein Pelo_19043 [Pelomyxa schiedti]
MLPVLHQFRYSPAKFKVLQQFRVREDVQKTGPCERTFGLVFIAIPQYDNSSALSSLILAQAGIVPRYPIQQLAIECDLQKRYIPRVNYQQTMWILPSHQVELVELQELKTLGGYNEEFNLTTSLFLVLCFTHCLRKA